MDNNAKSPFSAIKVVECGEGIAAAFGAKMLADIGADVIKVEPPGGDLARHRGPFPGDQDDPVKSGIFVYLNTNKRGVVADLTRPEGRELLAKLLANADVLIHNVRPPDRAARGLDSPQLCAAPSPVGPDRTVDTPTGVVFQLPRRRVEAEPTLVSFARRGRQPVSGGRVRVAAETERGSNFTTPVGLSSSRHHLMSWDTIGGGELLPAGGDRDGGPKLGRPHCLVSPLRRDRPQRSVEQGRTLERRLLQAV